MAIDVNGKDVKAGSKVRVLYIDALITKDMSPAEMQDVNSMCDGVFEVYEVDAYGQAWVEKWWYPGEEKAYSHSLGLSSLEMELTG